MPQLDIGAFEFQMVCIIYVGLFCHIMIRKFIAPRMSKGILLRDWYSYDIGYDYEFFEGFKLWEYGHSCLIFNYFSCKNSIFYLNSSIFFQKKKAFKEFKKMYTDFYVKVYLYYKSKYYFFDKIKIYSKDL